MGFGQQQKPTRLNQAQINQSAQGYPLPWVMGTARVQQSLLWEDGFGAQTVTIQGGKGGGKGGTEYLYYVDCIAALCNGPILGIGDVWSGQSWLGLPSLNESYTISSPGIYTPANAPAVATNTNNSINDVGVAFQHSYSGTFNDLGAPASTVLSGTDLSSLTKVAYGTTLTSGTYSFNPNSVGTFTLTSVANASGGNTIYTGTITGGASNAFAGYTFVIAGFTNAANNGSFICASSTATTLTLQNASGVAETHAATATEPGNTYHFAATADAGKTLTLTYSYYLPNITEDETDIIPSSKQIVVGGSLQFLTDLGVVYSAGPSNGTRLTKVNITPTVTGTYQCIPSGHGGTYKFATGDINAQVRITWITQDLSVVPQGQTRSLNFQLFQGTQGQNTWSVLTSKYPGAALGYSGKAYVAYHPMALGTSGQVGNNTFEVVTADMYGGGILDCNPVQCIGQVLTNQQCGLGAGAVPFPISVIDNGPSGTWGSAPSTPGTRQTGSTAWNWFAANSFFISPVLDSQDTAASVIGKWLEAGMCAAFYSEGLLKLVPYGDTTTAGYGCTWVAPSAYVVALDDTCFVGKEGEDPVKITRSAPQDAMNKVQVQWNNRSNQYSPEITQESDQASINKWGERIEDPQNWDFIHTLTTATVAASLRVKHNVYIRNTYEFMLPYSYSYLEPMDIITLSTTSTWAVGLNNANLGLVNQPVRILKIVDDPAKGLSLTCEDYPYGAHLPTLYNKAISAANVVSNAYANPGNVEVVMFEATSRLTGYVGNTIYIGAVGTSSNYGSCNVWVSRDNTNFEEVGTIQSPARLGVLHSTFASGSDPDTTNSLVIDMAENCPALVAGSTADADNSVTLCFVDGEYIAYSAMALSGQQQYTGSGYIRRGLFGTTISSHAAGSLFMRLDQSIFKYQYDPTWAGQTLYFKFQPVNAFGNSAVPLANLTSTSFTVPGKNPGTVEASSGLVIANTANGAGSLGWTPIATTTDAQVNYGITVAGSAALPAGVNTTYTYARWAGFLVPGVTGQYTIGVNSDDGANLFLGTTPIVSNLAVAQSASSTLAYTQSGKIMLTAGVYYPLLLEWQQGGGSYEIQLAWTPPGGSIQLIPAANLSTSNTSVTSNLKGTWWNGTPGLYYPTGDSFVDPSGSGVVMRGNIPPTLSGGFSYTATTSQMTITWNSNMALYRADGTSVIIGAGSQIITGLIPNTIYQFFPYWDQVSLTLKWVGSEVTFPSIAGVTLNGTNQEITTTTQFALAASFSWECWFKTTSSAAGNLGILTHGIPQTGNYTGAEGGIYMGGGGLTGFIENTVPATHSVAINTNYNDGQWHHAVLTFSGGTLTLYADGIQISQSTGLGSINTTSGWLRFGRGNLNQFFPGTISRVAYYTSALNIGQINNHYQASDISMSAYDTAVTNDAPTYYWKLTETSGTTATDSRGSNTGTYVNAPSLNQSSAIMAPDGSPAIAWSADTLLVQQTQSLNTREALSSGPLAFATPPSGSGGGGTGGTGSGSGGTGYTGGHGCFSGNTLVVTDRGTIAIRDVRIEDFVLTAASTWRKIVALLVYQPEPREMRNMGDDELVTPDHGFFLEGVKTPAGQLFTKIVNYDDEVFNLSVETDEEIERSYTLGNGRVASNFKLA